MGGVVVARLRGDLMANWSCGGRASLCRESRVYEGGGWLAPDDGFSAGGREAGRRDSEDLRNHS